MNRTCKTCKVTFDIGSFVRVVRKDKPPYWLHKCKNCCNVSQRDRRKCNPVTNICSGAKQRAKEANLEYDINPDYIRSIWPKDNKCPYLNIELIPVNGTRSRQSPSLDRIDNTKGYVKGNVQIISWLANTSKNNLTIDELILFCENCLNLHKKV